MQISERLEGAVLVLSVEGRLDNCGSDIFREKTLEHIRAGSRAIIVDFSGTTYIASLGIRALFIPAQELQKSNGRMVLAGLNADLKNLFLIGGLLDLFEVYATPALALSNGKWA